MDFWDTIGALDLQIDRGTFVWVLTCRSSLKYNHFTRLRLCGNHNLIKHGSNNISQMKTINYCCWLLLLYSFIFQFNQLYYTSCHLILWVTICVVLTEGMRRKGKEDLDSVVLLRIGSC